jgi:hypothetical protein
MLDLEESLGSLQPDRSLLLCYSASLTHVEYSLLHRLQSQGNGRVTLVVDPRSYAQSFAEGTAVFGAGIDYSYTPLHLPSPQAAFHPKLYLLFHENGATLFVASANLTLTGCRKNAEVVDQFHLLTDGSGDVRAMRQYVEFLDRLADVDRSLCPAVRDDILGAADMLRELLPAEIPESGPEFLHTLDVPLLDQVIGRIPANEIEEIIAVSPFFDLGSEVLLRLAASCGGAQIHLHRRPGTTNDINGRALAPIQDRLTVYDFKLAGAGDADRPLHAKWVLFRSGERAWLVAGSANLSGPAWLRTIDTDGNAEAVTLREVEDPAQWRDLTSLLAGAPLSDWTHLLPTRDATSEQVLSPGFRIREVRLDGERIYVHLLFDQVRWTGASFVLRVPGLPVPLSLERAGDAEEPAWDVRFWCTAPEAILINEAPTVVEVEGRVKSGETASARAWISRPYALERDADERAFRRSLRSMERRGLWTDAGDLIHVSDLLARLATRIAGIQAEEPVTPPQAEVQFGGSSSGKPKASQSTERWIAGVTVGEGGSAVGAHSTSEPGALLERIVASLRAAWKGRLDDLEDAQSRQEIRQRSGETAGYEEEDEGGDGSEEVPRLRASDVSALVRRLWEMAEEIEPDGRDDTDIYGRARMASALADFAFFLYLRLETSEERERVTVLRFLWDWFDRTFAIDGFALGSARGWMVDAWMDPATREQVERVWSARTTAIPMAALFGATLSLRVTGHPYSDEATRSLVAGFQLVSGWVDGQKEAERVDGLREYARAVSSFPGAPVVEDILNRALTPAIEHMPVFQLALQFAPLLRHQEGELRYRTGSREGETLIALRRQYERLASRRSPAILPMLAMGNDSVGCGHCRISLPLADSVRALQGAQALPCPQCGRLLLPFDFTDPGVCAVLSMVLTSAAPETK